MTKAKDNIETPETLKEAWDRGWVINSGDNRLMHCKNPGAADLIEYAEPIRDGELFYPSGVYLIRVQREDHLKGRTIYVHVIVPTDLALALLRHMNYGADYVRKSFHDLMRVPREG